MTTIAEPVYIQYEDDDGTLHDYLPPRDKQELAEQLEVLFGMNLADMPVCSGHSSPLDAIAASYFAESPVVVWVASRGFGGKTKLLSALAKLELLRGANVNLLGGSGEQSRRIMAYARSAWDYKPVVDGIECVSPFTNIVPNRPGQWKVETNNGNILTALTASTKAARGAHPQRLRLDEVDEMPEIVYEASLGQTMDDELNDIPAQITISSTHHYPDGLMTRVLKDANDNGWPVYHWCYRESLATNGGWLSDRQVATKKATVPAAMWDVEYELQEPSIEGRVFEARHINALFDEKWGVVEDFRDGRRYIFEHPVEGGVYVTGADWAKEKDWTEIVTLRTDVVPARLVCYERIQGKEQGVDYREMAERFENRVIRYGGRAIHDAVGVGASIADFLNIKNVYNYQTKSRQELYSGLVLAIEHGQIVMPVIPPLKRQFQYLRHGDVFGSSGHPPDGVSATALAWIYRVGAERSLKKVKTLGRMMQPVVIRNPDMIRVANVVNEF